MPPLQSALASVWEDVAGLWKGVVAINTHMDERADKCNCLLQSFPTADSFGQNLIGAIDDEFKKQTAEWTSKLQELQAWVLSLETSATASTCATPPDV